MNARKSNYFVLFVVSQIYNTKCQHVFDSGKERGCTYQVGNETEGDILEVLFPFKIENLFR